LTGYDLTKRFDSTIGFFWSAKHSQIYPELATLTKEGLVTFEVVTQTSKPNKKVYTITPAGREALTVWAAEDTEKRSVKDPLLMRVWAVGAVPADRVLPHLKACLEEYERRLAFLAETKEDLKAGPNALTPEQQQSAIGPFLAMRYGELQYAVYRDWLRDTIATLEKLQAPIAP
jgi:DNA-binding PadR family transcriptional regulator